MHNMGSKLLSLRSQLGFIPINGNFLLRISKLHVFNNRSGAIMCIGGGTNSQDSSWACSSVQLSVPQPNPCFIKRPYPVISGLFIFPQQYPPPVILTSSYVSTWLTCIDWSLSWNLGWEPTLSYLWYECQRRLEELKSIGYSHFYINK